MGEYLKKYKDEIFDVIDDAYGELYGVVPYTEGLRKSIISQFKLLLNLDCILFLIFLVLFPYVITLGNHI